MNVKSVLYLETFWSMTGMETDPGSWNTESKKISGGVFHYGKRHRKIYFMVKLITNGSRQTFLMTCAGTATTSSASMPSPAPLKG